MTDIGSLRQRIIAAYVLLACVVCSVFAAAAIHAIGMVEDRLIDQRLARTADQLAERQREGRGLDLPPNVALYQGDSLPAALRGLPAGRHELTMGGSTVNVLVRRAGGQNFVLTDDDADFESIRWQLHGLLAMAFVACLGLAVMLGRWTAGRVMAPVIQLAHAVDQDQMPDAYPLLDAKDEMGVLARSFAARTRTLQRFLVRERWFVSDVSHELRTPLAVILGAAEVLLSRVGERSEVAELAERIRRTAADTAERVAALLLLSRSPETIDAPCIWLAPIVRREMERCQPLLRGKQVLMTFELEDDVQVRARAELAGTAIGNLVRNACQYTERGAVTIRLEQDRLVIQDTGTGFPSGIHDQIFEHFVRVGPGHAMGSGLGLAIVRRVAEHLGWSVTLEDGPDKGSRFTLTWRASPM